MYKFTILIKPSGMTRLQLYCNTLVIEANGSKDLWEKLGQENIKTDDVELITLYRESHGNRVVCDAIRILASQTELKSFQFELKSTISIAAMCKDCGLIEFNICDGDNIIWTGYDFGHTREEYELVLLYPKR